MAAPAHTLADVELELKAVRWMIQAFGPEVRTVVMRNAIKTRDMAQARAPGSGRYAAAIKVKGFTEPDGGYTGKVFVDRIKDPKRGLLAANLPIWLEYGTRYASAKPHLIPAFAIGRASFDADMAALLRRVQSQAA